MHARTHTLWKLTRGHRLRYAAAIGAMGLALACLLAVPKVTQEVLDRVLPAGIGADPTLEEGGGWLRSLWTRVLGTEPGLNELLWTAALLILALSFVGGLFQYLQGRWSAVASEGIVRRLRDALFEHLSHLPCRYFDVTRTGDLVQRCSSDVETLRVFLSSQIVEIARASLQVLIALPILIVLDARMALLAVALFPLLVVGSAVGFRRIQKLFLDADEAEGRMTTVLQENLTGIRVVRAFARREHEERKFGAKNREFRDKSVRLIDHLGIFWSSTDLVCFLQIGLVLFAGAARLQAGTLSIGVFFAFMAYEALLIWPVRHMGRVIADTSKATVAMQRLREVLAEEPEVYADAHEHEPLEGRVEVEDLRFAFGEGEPALDGVSFTLEPGQTLALVGPPGSGKSTLIQLLLRLYDYEHGSIRLDGNELRSLDRGFVRSQIGAVLQEPFLYSRTIARNLRVGNERALQADLERAAEDADVREAIEGFPSRYETLVGERGVTLSGGQRQRLAIARALLKEAPLLILDDALSAVDTDTEARILAALRRRAGRRTTILAAHRLSTVQHADLVLVLERGRIVQSGSHAELVREDGPYARLWEIQTALEEEMGLPA